MNNKVKLMLKDAAILTIITLISGFLLALVFQVTKEPIELKAYEKKMDAYKTVFEEAKTFDESENAKKLLLESQDIISNSNNNLGKVGIEEILEAKGEGDSLGYVATVFSDEGYGGKIRISLGYDTRDKKLTKIEILEANETAGLGAKISTPEFKNQYSEKKTSHLNLVKSQVSKDDEIQALSGATISSTAVTNAVNAALTVLGGNNE